MKNLVLGSLLALTISQTTGCIITTDDGDPPPPPPPGDAIITAEWSFKDIATNQITPCPAGFNTVALYSQPVDGNLAPVGDPIIDLFNCSDGSHDSAPLPPDVYQVWIEVTTGSGGNVYAQSTSAIVDVVDTDKTFSATILNDGGYFMFDWALTGDQSGQPLTCATAGDPDSIEIISTLSGTTQGVVDKFNCGDLTGVTGGLLAGSYEVSIDAEKGGAAIGVAPTLTGEAIRDRNAVTDLGLVTIPIDGL